MAKPLEATNFIIGNPPQDCQQISDFNINIGNTVSNSISDGSNFNEYENEYQPILSETSSSLSNDNHLKVESIDIPIFQKEDRTIFITLTFPCQTIVRSIVGITHDLNESNVEYQVVSAYGSNSSKNFTNETNLLPGDYCFGLLFHDNVEASKIILIRLNVIIQPITNLMICQMISGLYRSLGFEPSHILKYPVKSENPGIPFYRKTRNEITKVNELILQYLNQSNNKSETDVNEEILKTNANIQNIAIAGKQIIQKYDEYDQKINTFQMNQNKIMEILPDIGKQLEKLGNQLEKISMAINKNSDVEKGLHENQNITVSDFEQLIEQKDTYYNKLIEAEDYIENLQDQLEELEKIRPKTIPKKKIP